MSRNRRIALRIAIAQVVILLLIFFLTLSFAHGHAPVAQAQVATIPPVPYNNNGITIDGNSAKGNFDTWGNSYSNNALTLSGYASGTQVSTNGYVFAWPTVAPGTNDNWQAAGQVIPLAVTGTMALLGAASNGPSSGTATITYTDGTTQAFSLTFSDWTLNGGKSTVLPSNTIVAKTTYRNTSTNGTHTENIYVFLTTVTLATGKTTQSVTLPSTITAGQLHVFAVSGNPAPATPTATTAPAATATTAPVATATTAPALTPTATSTVPSTVFNNNGITPDTSPGTGNYDTWGNSYSDAALTTDGFASGTPVTTNGYTFNWPNVAISQNDNWQSAGQVIAVSTTGTLAFLGSATNGPSSGTAIVTYTDGTTQTFTLTFSDWTLNGGRSVLNAADAIAATMPYRNTKTGKNTETNYVFFTSVALTAGKTTSSVTLPSTVSAGQLHVLAVSGATGTTPTPTATPTQGPTATATTVPVPTATTVPVITPTALPGSAAPNNEGIAPDATPGSGNYDTWGNNYSNEALSAAGFASGVQAISNGFVFTWPTIAVGQNDNWQAAGQTIQISTTGTLAFLGSATNGPASGTATITYTDGTTQTFTLAFSDWTLNGGRSVILASDAYAATMTYRDGTAGKEAVSTYLFFTSVPLTAGKTTQSVTLPATVTAGQLHVIAISGTISTITPTATSIPPTATATIIPPTPAPSSAGDWTSYGFGPDHTFNNPNETKIGVTTAPNLTLKWTGSGPQGISGQPIIASGSVYWGSWDGYVRAATISGNTYWSTFVGQTTVATCQPPTAGVGGSVAYGSVNGTAAIFAGGGDGKLYALNAQTGAVLWSTLLGNTASGYFIWDSPTVSGGNVYIGISSFGDCPTVQGKLFSVNAATGAIQGTFNIVQNGCTGGGLWGSPTLDTTNNVIYIATGNISSCSNEPYAQAVVAVNASTMAEIASWQIPSALAAVAGDADFGNTPTLFSGTVNGVTTPLVGVASKDGQFYAFTRVTPTFTGTWAPLWTDNVANAGSCPDCGGGSVSPASFDGSTLFIGGGDFTLNGTACKGTLNAVNPSTGAFLWQVCFTDGHVLGAVVTANGVVVASHGPTVSIYNAATGGLIYKYTDTNANSLFWSAPTIANGQLYIGNMNGDLLALG